MIDYQEEYKKQLKVNIGLVRKNIDNPDFVLKITNHAEKYERSYDEVREKIMNDDMYAEIFAKDPSKQNIYENLAADYISKLSGVSNFRNLPNSTNTFVIEGKVVQTRSNNVKSVDFTFNIGKYSIYASHKYIKATNGGAQGNQYNEVCNYLRNCNKVSEGDNYFIAICDGPYFENKIKLINYEFGSERVIAMNISDLESFVNKLFI